jgi:hypothetical protein
MRRKTQILTMGGPTFRLEEGRSSNFVPRERSWMAGSEAGHGEVLEIIFPLADLAEHGGVAGRFHAQAFADFG